MVKQRDNELNMMTKKKTCGFLFPIAQTKIKSYELLCVAFHSDFVP